MSSWQRGGCVLISAYGGSGRTTVTFHRNWLSSLTSVSPCHWSTCGLFLLSSPQLTSNGPCQAETQRGDKQIPGIYTVRCFFNFILGHLGKLALNDSSLITKQSRYFSKQVFILCSRSSLAYPEPEGYQVPAVITNTMLCLSLLFALLVSCILLSVTTWS